MEEKTPLIYNKTSTQCICGCGEPLPRVAGQIQLFISGHRKEGRARSRHKKFYQNAYK